MCVCVCVCPFLSSSTFFLNPHVIVHVLKSNRIVQKGLFAALAATGGNSSGKKAVAPIVSGVLDVVRTMIVCISMKDAAGIIEMIVQMSKDGKVIVVRLKERFLSAASAGGWRDALINVYIPSGPGGKLKHICELQIVHTSLYMARAKLPGHAIYGKTRNVRWDTLLP